METDLPNPLELLSDNLSREARSLAVQRQLQGALKQAKSSLSFIRQDAYLQIAQLLEAHLTDQSTAGSLFDVLLNATSWSFMLQSLQTALNCVISSATESNSTPHATAELELVALLGVVQVTCMAHPYAKQSLCGGGLLQLLLDCLTTSQPALVCACLDTLMSVQLNHAPGFQHLVQLGGVQQISTLVMSPTAPDKVRSWAARFLNLTMTHLVPGMLERERAAADEAQSVQGLPAGAVGAEASAQVQQSFDAARHSVEKVLGRDAAALLMRKVDLQDHQAESKLEQLGQALSFFLQQ